MDDTCECVLPSSVNTYLLVFSKISLIAFHAINDALYSRLSRVAEIDE